MLCKFCKRDIEEDSIFCRYCGEKVQRNKKKVKEEVSVPPPKKTALGKYRGRVMVDGVRTLIIEDTEDAYYIRAKAVKAKMLEQAKNKPKAKLCDLIDKYIDDNEAVLSPSTVLNYRAMRKHRFTKYMDLDVNRIEWQQLISAESRLVGAKTVKNGWRLVTAALRYAKVPVPTVNLPSGILHESTFLDYEQLSVFMAAIEGEPDEIVYLLALHSLRLSEILALTDKSFRNGNIMVRGARVPGPYGMVTKELNKTDSSRRDVPVMIDRLDALLPGATFPVRRRDKTLNDRLSVICEKAGLPTVTVHGLRHSFASLAYHLKWSEKMTMRIGGWSTPDVVQRVYTHLSEKDVSYDVLKMRAFYAKIQNEKKAGR